MHALSRASASIMAVDDEPANLRLLEKLLVGEGYAAPTCIADPRHVLPRYSRQRPDLILLDLNMPHLSGFEVLLGLRNLKDPLLPPVIVLTGRDDATTVLECLALGIRDVVIKPFARAELLMRVRNLLDVHLAQSLMLAHAVTLERLVQQRTQQLQASRLQITQLLGRAAGYRDNETGAHVTRMSHVAVLLADELGWDAEQRDLILNASPMHDIGKIGIPDSILLKPGPLTPAEWRVMQTHTEIGARILSDDQCPLLRMAQQIALRHHERWDGSGYPGRLAGTAIPLAARIVAVADVFDALLSTRPYKQAWSWQDAVSHMRAQSGHHFDPAVIAAFLHRLDEIGDILETNADAVAPASVT